MYAIWKYPIPSASTYFSLELPENAQILSFQSQFNYPYIWVKVNPENPKTKRNFLFVGTGQEFDEENLIFIGTTQLGGGTFVFHLFEIPG